VLLHSTFGGLRATAEWIRDFRDLKLQTARPRTRSYAKPMRYCARLCVFRSGGTAQPRKSVGVRRRSPGMDTGRVRLQAERARHNTPWGGRSADGAKATSTYTPLGPIRSDAQRSVTTPYAARHTTWVDLVIGRNPACCQKTKKAHVWRTCARPCRMERLQLVTCPWVVEHWTHYSPRSHAIPGVQLM